jgi:hypothetical protein
VVAITLPLVVGLTLSAIAFGRHSLDSDRRAAHALFRSTNLNQPDSLRSTRDFLKSAMKRHPAEPYFARLGAILALRAGDADAMPWIQRALELELGNGKNHLILADVLAQRGARNQSLLALRTAAESHHELTGPAARKSLSLTTDFATLQRAVPAGPKGADFLVVIATLSASLRERALDEALARDPKHAGASRHLAGDLVVALEKREPRCAAHSAAKCAERARALVANTEPRHEPIDAELRARLLRVEGKLGEATALLESSCPAFSIRQSCLRLLIRFALEHKDFERASRATKEVIALSCTSASACATTTKELAGIYASSGAWGEAAALYERAARESGLDADWKSAADAASRAGYEGRSSDLRARAARGLPNPPVPPAASTEWEKLE